METTKNQSIFESICDIISDAEFNQGQLAFFNKNCSEFNSEEENKHSHKEIHEEYIRLLESAIDVQIQQKYSSAEMDGFYLDFKENFTSYKKINEEAFNIMIASIDFQLFKEQMINQKVTEPEQYDQKLTQDYGKQGSHKYFDLASEDFNDPKLNWTKILELKKDGYSAVVHRRPLEGDTKGCNMMKAELKYSDAKIDWYNQMVRNGPPMDNMVERRFIKQEGDYRYYYLRVKIGKFVSDREVVIRKLDTWLDDGSLLYSIESVDLPEEQPRKDYVRMEMFKTVLVKQDPESPDDLLVTEYSNMDMKGYFPPRIMNMMTGAILSKGYAKLRKVLTEIKANQGVYVDPHEETTASS